MAQAQAQTAEREATAGEELLRVEDLRATVDGREILKGISLVIKRGETHAIMGPNGSGKSTLAYLLMGRPGYDISGGKIVYKGEDISETTADERARRGLFLAFQYPQEIPGVSVVNFLRTARNAAKGQEMSALEFHKLLREKMKMLDMPEDLVKRYVNSGFSGGEKKRNEILQMAVLEPDLAVLDETDSGLDIDALRSVSEGVKAVAAGDKKIGILLITHYQRILNYITPDVVHVLVNGRIAKSGGPELAAELEKSGYDAFREEAAAEDRGPLP